MCEPGGSNTCASGFFCQTFASVLPSTYGYCRVSGGGGGGN
jgi:hypothetical protein